MDDFISQEDFKQFVCCKAYDIISEGRYRKYHVRSKACNEPWAISMQRSVNNVQSRIKNVLAAVRATEGIPESCMWSVCQEVIANLSPPSRVREGSGVCCITGVRSDCCIDLTPLSSSSQPPLVGSQPGSVQDEHKRFMDRLDTFVLKRQKPSPLSGGASSSDLSSATTTTDTAPTAWKKTNTEFLIHPKLSFFFLMLWYVCKIEHVVRNYTRSWLETTSASSDDNHAPDIASLCRLFSDQDAFSSMCSMFNHGASHVQESVASFVAEHSTQQI